MFEQGLSEIGLPTMTTDMPDSMERWMTVLH